MVISGFPWLIIGVYRRVTGFSPDNRRLYRLETFFVSMAPRSEYQHATSTGMDVYVADVSTYHSNIQEH